MDSPEWLQPLLWLLMLLMVGGPLALMWMGVLWIFRKEGRRSRRQR